MATLEIYWKNGSYDCFTSTNLPFSDGFLLENERIVLDIESIIRNGIVWERDFFATEEIDSSQNGKVISRIVVVTADELGKVGLICLNGQPYIASQDDELVNVFFEQD